MHVPAPLKVLPAGALALVAMISQAAAQAQPTPADPQVCATVWDAIAQFGGSAEADFMFRQGCAFYSDANGSYDAYLRPTRADIPGCTEALQSITDKGLSDHLYFLSNGQCPLPDGAATAAAPPVLSPPAISSPAIGAPTAGGAPVIGQIFTMNPAAPAAPSFPSGPAVAAPVVPSFTPGGSVVAAPPVAAPPVAAPPSSTGFTFPPSGGSVAAAPPVATPPPAGSTGFAFPPVGSSGVVPGRAPPSGTPVVERVFRDVQTIPVGKWPEGIAFDPSDSTIFVAESGVRRVAEVAVPSGRVVNRYNVGRLPVEVVSPEAGRVYALVHTDSKLWRFDRGSGPKNGATSGVPGCPEGLAADRNGVFIMTWVDCSSAATRVYAIPPRGGQPRLLADLDGGAFGMAVTDTAAVVVRTMGQNSWLTYVDRRGGGIVDDFPLDRMRLLEVAAAGGTVYAAGAIGPEGGETGMVVSRDAAGTYREAEIPEPVGALATDGAHVVAVSRGGRIYVLDAGSLALVREIETSADIFAPQAVALAGSRLFITTHRGSGDNGSVIVVDDWKPRAVVRR